MKLTAELVPKTVWHESLAKLLPRSVWNGIREDIIERDGRKCQICGETEGTMSLHEIWDYDDVNHIQKLDGVILLCGMCHHVKHLGLAGILAREGKLDYNEVMKHFCKVNDCSEKDSEKHTEEAFRIWRKRSEHNWKQDFGKYDADGKEQQSVVFVSSRTRLSDLTVLNVSINLIPRTVVIKLILGFFSEDVMIYDVASGTAQRVVDLYVLSIIIGCTAP